mmetsp:Transcript_13115/g.34893  ORF Transcript_13115/g.34893 Transcript_13115/m.34893 type:complete len:100 (-) Transcript_13115:937-1236(-)
MAPTSVVLGLRVLLRRVCIESRKFGDVFSALGAMLVPMVPIRGALSIKLHIPSQTLMIEVRKFQMHSKILVVSIVGVRFGVVAVEVASGEPMFLKFGLP